MDDTESQKEPCFEKRSFLSPPPGIIWKKSCAEFVGTFGLMFAGCGSIMVAAKDDKAGNPALFIAAAWGLVLACMVYSTGHICGAHFNPAVSLAFAVAGKFPWSQVPYYFASQFLAALSACFLLRAFLGDVASMGATVPAGSPWVALGFEIIASFFLMFVIASVAMDSRSVKSSSGIIIGGIVATFALIGGGISGASMNPARSLGPAVVSQNLKHLWVYFVGPPIGTISGALVYNFICCSNEPLGRASGCCDE